MKSLRSSLNYILPIAGLLLVNLIYFYPAIEGKILEQDDIMLGYAKGKEIRDYREKQGEEPLWTQAMFSGMPTFQLSIQYANNWISYIQKSVSLVGGRTSSIYIIFNLMLGFYLLMIAMKVNPWLSAVGAIAFSFSAFFIISFGAGHNAKVRTAAYIAPVVMGVLLTYRKKYLAGFALTALFVGLSIHSNHFQITYYMGILLLVIAVVEFIYAFRRREQPQFWKASGLLVLAAALGVGPNISNLWSTYEYQKETMRGGSSELSSMKESQGGLTFDYAMNWSYGIAETFNLIIADFTGGGMAQDYEGTELHESFRPRVVQSLTSRGVSRSQAEQQADQYLGSMFYWGEQSLVNGGYYVGAVVFFLFVFGLFLVDGRLKWWVVAATLLAFMLAWGKHFRVLNEFMYDYVPLYNKFRVPSMTFVIAFFTMPFLGFYAVNKLLKGDYDKKQIQQKLLYSLYITGGICLFFILLGGAFFDFVGPRDAQLGQQGIDLGMLESDRVSLMRGSALKTLVFCGLSFGVLWLLVQQKLKPAYAIAALAVLVIADQWSFVKQHVNADDFVSERAYENVFAPSPADQTILQDPDPFYRVFNTTAGLTSDSYTSYYHHSIGGYHGAKLIRYQDLIENQLSQNNMACFNMLNAKWFIVQDERTGQKRAQRNPNACGNAWLVDEIKLVPDADAEMAALSDFDPKTTAVVDQRYADEVPEQITADEQSQIRLKDFGLKHMVYEADVRSPNQFAVFSEIYYEGGNEDWKTYLDGEQVDHIRVNYLLRGMRVPEGKHTIEFKFHPRSYYLGEKISLVLSIILFAVLITTLVLQFKYAKGQDA